MRDDPLLALAMVFIPFSLVSIGGGPSIFAGIQHETVDVHRWMDARSFVEYFAIARAAPGPGSMLSTLVGWHVAGWTGAAVATLALFLPSSILCFALLRVWHRYRGRSWHTAVESGLAPVGGGLILAGVIAIFRIAEAGALAWAVAIASAGVLAWRPRFQPLILFALAGGLFVLVRGGA